ncbi:MAG TPA: SH3 domain-containing protein [Clostridiales bacterium]|nr:SH3 domain-containing protein [Clostridiales bacterium]
MKKLIPLLLSFLIILSLIPLDVQASSNYSTIKVGLTRLPLSSQVTFTVNGTYSVSGDDSTVLANKKTYNVKVESGKLALYDGQTLIKRYSSPLKLVAGAYNTSNSLKISTNSYPYCGNMIFTISSGNIFLINEVGFEEYILGVLPGEMPKNWHKEALKAQAVAARSYTLANRNRHSGAGYEICDNEHCQMYIGYIGDNNLGNAGAAVAETRGQYLTYNGKPISACYCSSNGGITESANNAWGSADVPYLVVKEDPHDIAYRNQTVTIKKQGFDSTLANNIKNIILTKKLLNNKGYSLQPNDITVKSINNLKITEYNKTGGRAAKAVLDVTLEVKRTSDGKKEEITQSITLIRGEIRSVLGLRSLLIVKFEEDKDKDCYRLVTNGYGHGVGMGQYGAKARAEAGHGYKNILSFYYPGTTMATISYPDVTPPSVSSVSANPDCIVAGEANSTKINYTLSKASKVTVVINDASGKRVRDLMTNTDKAKGSHSITWDLKNNSGSKVGQGVYTFVVIAQDGEGNKASRSGTVEIVTKKSGTVTASSLNIRKGPGTSYAVLTTLPKGTKVDILSKANGWYKVRLSDGRIGYAVENYISEGGSSGGDSQPSGREGIVTASALNVRKSASTSSSVLGVLRKNDRVEILGKTGSWYKIKAGKLTGYVHGDYLKEVTPVSPPSSGGNDKKPPEDKAPPPDKKYGIVTASALNVRSGAGTKNSRIGVIQKNTKVEILGTSGEWYKIKAGSLTGYVHGDYIKITSGGSTPSDPTPPAGKTYGTVTASALNVRKSASTSAAKVGLLPKGKQVEILGSSGKWYKIKSGSITGYVHSDYIKITSGGGSSSSSTKTVTVTASSGLNVRSGPGTNYKRITVAKKGTKLQVLSQSGKWLKVKLPSGTTGYVISDYVK